MPKMPLLFIGHGSPMNAIEDNEFTVIWKKIATRIPRPLAILSVSAHWYTDGTRINDESRPKTIYDMYGFPGELYRIVYGAPGASELAGMTKDLIKKRVAIDNSWGYDHGTWAVLHVMYPRADIPVFQLSVDRTAGPEAHFEIGKEIKSLRNKGVLILGSGNVVHNLAMADFSMDRGYEWAYEFDRYIKDKIVQRDFNGVLDYRKAGASAHRAVPLPDHFYPLLYPMGASDEDDEVSVYNEDVVLGSVSMTCYCFSGKKDS